MKKKIASNEKKKLTLDKTILKNLTVRTGLAAGLDKCTSTCVPGGSAGTSTGVAGCCTFSV